MNSKLKTIDRKIRVVRLNAIVRAFSAFTEMELNRSLMYRKNDWREAEKTRDLIHLFFPDRAIKTEQFLYRQNDLAEKALSLYDEYKKWLYAAGIMGIPESTVNAFCRNADKTFSLWMLKATGHLHYPLYLDSISRYLDGTISKRKLKDSFVEISIFDGKKNPANLRLFRRAIIRMESLLDEILQKQADRRRMSVNEFVDEGKINGLLALHSMPDTGDIRIRIY
jgi:hypothetical protein